MFKKPGKKKKLAKIMNRKARLHDITPPEEKYCRHCHETTGTERYAHYEGFRKHEFGKGVGVKCDDRMTAWLCQKCTDYMDKKPTKPIQLRLDEEDKENIFQCRILEHSEEWLYLICKTWLL